jgi:hypothetical protein
MFTIETVSQPSPLDYAALIVAAASSVVIAIQAFMTRAAVKASQDTVKVAERTLGESQLARLESQVPRIFISVRKAIFVREIWLLGESTGAGGSQGKRVVVGENDLFYLPRDAQRLLSASFEFEIRNDGPGTVQLTVTPKTAFMLRSQTYVLEANETRACEIEMRQTVQDWVKLAEANSAFNEAAEASAHDEPKPPRDDMECMWVKVEYKGPRDSDIDELHEIKLYGSLLEEDSDLKGTWVPVTALLFADPITAIASPARRTYYRSRIAGTTYDA